MTRSAYDQWLALFEASATRDATFTTMSGVPLAPVYGPKDAASDAEFPGLFPYTRGVHASMYRISPLDDADVRRFRHRARHEPALQGDHRRGRPGPLDGL